MREKLKLLFIDLYLKIHKNLTSIINSNGILYYNIYF